MGVKVGGFVDAFKGHPEYVHLIKQCFRFDDTIRQCRIR